MPLVGRCQCRQGRGGGHCDRLPDSKISPRFSFLDPFPSMLLARAPDFLNIETSHSALPFPSPPPCIADADDRISGLSPDVFCFAGTGRRAGRQRFRGCDWLARRANAAEIRLGAAVPWFCEATRSAPVPNPDIGARSGFVEVFTVRRLTLA